MKNRRYFLKTACKPIVLAALGIPVIEACSSEDDSSVSTQTTSSSNNSSPQGGTSTELIIDLDDNTFSSLQETGGWLNFTSENILYKCGWSPFEGVTFKSRITHTILNGNLVYQNNKFTNKNSAMRLTFNR